ncbi:hypothetical protein [Piscinibacter koreensis]|uniref:Uncharacterized protein n=1 Tax=Piscinibacter koreensis TaxID=2742824 RepID=A0A7Y6NP66_9BURK|nr:hypothetical protein [Schlegelella koreensis]NUZ06682.1 hypothetical protein [Schlegelella koreensis]
MLGLLVVLVLVQTLGLLHRAAHARHILLDRVAASQAMGDGVIAPFVASSECRAGVKCDRGWLRALFAGHDQLRQCEHYDDLSADVLAFGSAPVLLQASPQNELPAAHSAWHVAAQAQGFLARGPPIA